MNVKDSAEILSGQTKSSANRADLRATNISHRNGLKENIIGECQRMKRTMRYHKIGFHHWPWVPVTHFVPEGPSECGICTNSARLLAFRFNGYVVGYPIGKSYSNRERLIGASSFGHDFAVISNFLVDWWAWAWEESLSQPVLSLSDPIVRARYKPASEWIMNRWSDYRVIK
jgi:hypothetical protein